MSLNNSTEKSSTSMMMNNHNHHNNHHHLSSHLNNNNNNNETNNNNDDDNIDDPLMINLLKDFFNAQFELKKSPIPFPSNVSSSTSLSSFTSTINNNNNNNKTSSVNYNQIRMALRALGKSFEELYEKKLYEMIIKLDLHSQNVYSLFDCLSNEIFIQGIQWNHIITYFVFTVDFAYYANQNHAAKINDVYTWLLKYTNKNLLPWIKKNGGWNGIVNFAQEVIGDIPENENALFKMNFKNILYGAAGALGILSLGFFLSSK